MPIQMMLTDIIPHAHGNKDVNLEEWGDIKRNNLKADYQKTSSL